MNVKFFNGQLNTRWFEKTAMKDTKQRLADWFFTQAKQGAEVVADDFNKEGRAIILNTSDMVYRDYGQEAFEKFTEKYISENEVYGEVAEVRHLFNKHFAKMQKEFYADPEVKAALGLED